MANQAKRDYLMLVGYKNEEVKNMSEQTVNHLYTLYKEKNLKYSSPDLLDKYKGEEKKEIIEIVRG